MIRILKIQLFAVVLLSFTTVQAQVKVGLDNWFNNETHTTTGLPFHYLWNDSADSGFSRWGDIFLQKGAQLQTLKKPTKNILKAIDIYIIVDPDSSNETAAPNYIMTDDAKTIEEWVKKGGVLVLLANDSKHCGLSHLNTLSSRFGMTFSNAMLHPVTNNQYEMGAYTGLPNHPLFKDLKKIFMKEVASINLFSNTKAVLEDNGQAVMAECRHGKGFVFAVGDPWLYNEYIDHDRLPIDFENHKAAENVTVYLISKTLRDK